MFFKISGLNYVLGSLDFWSSSDDQKNLYLGRCD